jgi:hypothetical protein
MRENIDTRRINRGNTNNVMIVPSAGKKRLQLSRMPGATGTLLT